MSHLLVCDICGIRTYHVYVHGHYQCSDCKVVSYPCCDGEYSDPDFSSKRVNDQENIKRLKDAEKASQ